jgi:hypothetical protein
MLVSLIAGLTRAAALTGRSVSVITSCATQAPIEPPTTPSGPSPSGSRWRSSASAAELLDGLAGARLEHVQHQVLAEEPEEPS